MRKTVVILGLGAICLLFLGLRSGDGQAPADTGEQAIRQAVAAYAEAFNKGDVAGLGAVWTPDAEYIDEAGNVTKGRDAIVALFKKFLADNKGAKMGLKVTKVRPFKGDVVLQDGTTTMTLANGTVDEGRYSAVWSKTDGRWQIASARDLPYEAGAVPGAGGPIKELRWLVGDWEAEKGGLRVSCRWALDQAFLLQEYRTKDSEGDLTVTQLVGFDPLTGLVKSWTFDSRGGYGEGLWQRDGNSWVSETAGVLPDGQVGGAINVVRFVDDQTFVFQSRDREVGGQPIPDAEVKFVRKAAAK
jgi:uncharacterized protein (TIGR02246 family)